VTDSSDRSSRDDQREWEAAFEEEEEDPLGAAATVPVGGDKGRGGGAVDTGGPSRPRRSSPARGTALLVVGGLVLLALLPVFASSFKKTPRDRVGISYGGGVFEGTHFQRLVAPGSSLFFNGIADKLFLYPAGQRNYIISKAKDEGATKRADSVIAPTRDRVQVEYQVAVYYKLNTDQLRPFHEQIGLRYAAYTDTGWDRLIQDTFRQQIESALQEQTRRYDVAEIYGSADRLITIQNDVRRSLSERLQTALGRDFFCAPTFRPAGKCDAPTFLVKKIDIPASVVKAFEDNRTSQVAILTNQNIVQQRAAEAQAIQQLQGVLSGPAGANYVLMKAIESGKITFWVVPNDSGLTLQTPSGATPNGAPSNP
jgi:regulator of protease activity HflC (stomatin/prohibitin superfamily)